MPVKKVYPKADRPVRIHVSIEVPFYHLNPDCADVSLMIEKALEDFASRHPDDPVAALLASRSVRVAKGVIMLGELVV